MMSSKTTPVAANMYPRTTTIISFAPVIKTPRATANRPVARLLSVALQENVISVSFTSDKLQSRPTKEAGSLEGHRVGRAPQRVKRPPNSRNHCHYYSHQQVAKARRRAKRHQETALW